LIALLMVSNTVRVLDLVLLTKEVEPSELRDADGTEVGQLRVAGRIWRCFSPSPTSRRSGAGWSRAAWQMLLRGRCSGGRSG